MILQGKTVLVTGAGGGLGQALCLLLLKAGARVAAVDLDQIGLDVLARQAPHGLLTFQCDITNEAKCQDVVAQVGAIDILINNAGITHFSKFQDMEPQTIKKVMEVNFFGAVNMTYAALPSILKRSGKVVAISSVAGFSPLYGRSGYSASKHAMQGFFDSLRSEVAEAGVHVMMVCPSFIASQQAGGTKGGDTARPGSATQTAGKPLSPDFVAEEILAGLKSNRRLLNIGRVSKLSYWVNKISPKLFETVMTKKIKSEFSEDVT
ncbi:MAG: SDR family oxidoreductase [Sneathiella sp.]